MRLIVFLLAFTASASAVADDQARKLIDTIGSLRAPLKDFRCEFEGSVRAAAPTAPRSPAESNQPDDLFSGTFLWTKDGGFWCDSFHEGTRRGLKIERRTIGARMKDNHAEEHRRFNDAVDGKQTMGSPRVFRGRLELDGPQDLLLREDLRDQILNETHTVSIRDDKIDGRALKVVEIRVRDVNQLWRRYWIDLARNGLIVRVESFWSGDRLNLRRDIKVAKFELAGAEIWMPVSAEQTTYSPPSASETGESHPESISTVSIVRNTVAFNSGVDAKNFVAGYRTGKPISESGRRRSDQYDLQTASARTIDAALQKGLKDLPAQEVEQDPVRDLVIPPERQFDIRYVGYGLGVVAIIALGRVWVRRRLEN